MIDFHYPDIKAIAEVAEQLDAQMALASAAAENAAVNGITAVATWLSMHSATPGTTGASELSAAGTVNLAATAAITYSGAIATVNTAAAHGLSTGNSTTFAGVVSSGGAGAGHLQTLLNGLTFTVTVLTTTSFTVTMSATPSDSWSSGGNVTTGYARVLVTWGSASSGQAANASNALVSNIPAGNSVSYFGTWTAVTSGTYEIGGALSSTVSFTTAGTFTVAVGGLTLSAS